MRTARTIKAVGKAGIVVVVVSAHFGRNYRILETLWVLIEMRADNLNSPGRASGLLCGKAFGGEAVRVEVVAGAVSPL